MAEETPLRQSVFERARAETLGAFHTFRFWLFELCVPAGFGVLAQLWQPSWVPKGTATVIYQVVLPLFGVLLGLSIFFLASLIVAPYRQRNEARRLVAEQRQEPDYWRCPDGKLHDWIYWRGASTGIYLCRNCRMQVDKPTLKAHTDQGPPLSNQ